METGMIVRAVNFVILLSGYIAIIMSALTSLRKRQLSSTHTALWVIAILFFPLIGAIALWSVNPQNEATCHEETGQSVNNRIA